MVINLWLHGWSHVVAYLLTGKSKTKHLSIICLEGQPNAAGTKVVQFYTQAGIPTMVVLDSTMGYIVEGVDMVLVGAKSAVENEGIVNNLGIYALAICVKEHGILFYVASESHKFARLYPLHQQRDLPPMDGSTLFLYSMLACDGMIRGAFWHMFNYLPGSKLIIIDQITLLQIHHIAVYRFGSHDSKCHVG
jgi:hypothetical protein